MEHWVDLSAYGLQLRMAQDRGRAEWCVLPAPGYTTSAFGLHADKLRDMGFLGDRPGLFHHPVDLDRRRQPRRPLTADVFQAHGFRDAREIPFDAQAHVFQIRAAEPVQRDPVLERDLVRAQQHADGEAGTLGRLMDAAIAYARRHNLDAEEAFRESHDEGLRPPGP